MQIIVSVRKSVNSLIDARSSCEQIEIQEFNSIEKYLMMIYVNRAAADGNIAQAFPNLMEALDLFSCIF